MKSEHPEQLASGFQLPEFQIAKAETVEGEITREAMALRKNIVDLKSLCYLKFYQMRM